jgi:outer membrane protein OmpA-like peptidoglycan-associated protein
VAIPVWPAILFEGGAATLDAADKAELVQIAQFMVAHAGVKVAFTGHTDMGRTAAERQAIGLARAKAAATVLTANGVAAPRVTTLSRGGNAPVASNSTAAGRAANRRVTIAMTEES